MGYRNKFIKVFVNEMYAILIGIGIGNVLFASEFNFQDFKSVLSLLFVTAIVLTYWWDWTEYVEGEVSNSKREMALDFGILIVLEMLFAYYSSMQSIAYIFLVTAVLDLLWVLNHLHETKMYKGDTKQRKRTKTWLAEKFMGIGIYILLIIAVKYTDELISHSIVEYITLTEVILAFVIVRKVSFNQIHKVNISNVVLADLEHIDGILSINHSYFGEESEGLLLKKYSQLEIIKALQESRLFVALDFENVVLGYATIDYCIDEDILVETQPIIHRLYNKLKVDKLVYIEQIAVMKQLEKNGIASAIVTHLNDSYPKHLLSSYVAIEPLENISSLNFHLNNGFKKTGIFTNEYFADRENYLSYLLVKDTNKL
ncbi:MAG: GNAT family N-acetyltransferase [Clostridiales bacterium]|nr:GNAT family N-acetyltransferase [Clostridiales bacterium]